MGSPYGGVTGNRVLLGPTFRKDAVVTAPIWLNFGADTDATNINNSWVSALNVGDLYLRDERVPRRR